MTTASTALPTRSADGWQRDRVRRSALVAAADAASHHPDPVVLTGIVAANGWDEAFGGLSALAEAARTQWWLGLLARLDASMDDDLSDMSPAAREAAVVRAWAAHQRQSGGYLVLADLADLAHLADLADLADLAHLADLADLAHLADLADLSGRTGDNGGAHRDATDRRFARLLALFAGRAQDWDDEDAAAAAGMALVEFLSASPSAGLSAPRSDPLSATKQEAHAHRLLIGRAIRRCRVGSLPRLTVAGRSDRSHRPGR